MNIYLIIAVCLSYFILIYGVNLYIKRFELNKSDRFGAMIYALSLGVYCSAWTFFGSIGNASRTGLGFLGVYIGPSLLAPLFIVFLKKIIRISRYLRITSIADFISSRYGKSTSIGLIVSLMCVFFIVPYISIQLKAMQFSFSLMRDFGVNGFTENANIPFFQDPSLYFGLACGLFAILYGTIKLDPTEKHPALVNFAATESIIKLLCFLIGAIAIVFVIKNNLSESVLNHELVNNFQYKFVLNHRGISYSEWLCITLLSAFAFIFLPRQFHVAVVENKSVAHLKTASWFIPLYLFLISIFVIPVALVGNHMFSGEVEADTFLLSIPISQSFYILSIVVFIGGLAAMSGMIIVSVLTLSTMISNNIFLPILLRLKNQYTYFLEDLNKRILELRRLIILVLIIFSYGFYVLFSKDNSLVSIGLISFAGIAQFAPAVLGGLYWKYATRIGVTFGLVVGFIIWFYTLPYANIINSSSINSEFIETTWILKSVNPNALFGFEGWSPIVHGTFISLFFNSATFFIVSLLTKRSISEVTQSDIFLNPEKYYKASEPIEVTFERNADFNYLKNNLIKILGAKRTNEIINGYRNQGNEFLNSQIADSKFINYIEKHLSGALGTATSKILLGHMVEQKPIDIQELSSILDQTYQVYEYSQNLKRKSSELKKVSKQLRNANKQLLELDNLKDEFISNVTHELRTPITSILSISDILLNKKVSESERIQFQGIIYKESQRIARLVNQVLDLRKLEINPNTQLSEINLLELLTEVTDTFIELKQERQIIIKESCNIYIHSERNILKQVLINLISNAIKFTHSKTGVILIEWKNDVELLEIKDNGVGIKKEDQQLIFDRFYQVRHDQELKQKGSGLGLAICKSYLQSIDGDINVQSVYGEGSTFIISGLKRINESIK